MSDKDLRKWKLKKKTNTAGDRESVWIEGEVFN